MEKVIRVKLLKAAENVLTDLHSTYYVSDLPTSKKYVFVGQKEFTTMFIHRLNQEITNMTKVLR